MSTQILTPVGRLVAGDTVKPQTTDAEGKPLLNKSGANIGQPRVDYYLGLAIPKTDPAWPALMAAITAEAVASFPALFPNGACILPTFAFKVTDGDSQIPNKKGNKPCDKEGYPGNWILSLSSGFAPKCFSNSSPAPEPITADQIKRGYYIRVSGSVAGNKSQSQPGVFVNHNMVQLVGFGEEIHAGPDAAEAFGAAAAMPAGASATPVAGGAMPAATGAPAAAATGGIAPAPDFVDAAAGAAPAPTPEPQSRVVNGSAHTEAALLAAGWTQDKINALPLQA